MWNWYETNVNPIGCQSHLHKLPHAERHGCYFPTDAHFNPCQRPIIGSGCPGLTLAQSIDFYGCFSRFIICLCVLGSQHNENRNIPLLFCIPGKWVADTSILFQALPPSIPHPSLSIHLALTCCSFGAHLLLTWRFLGARLALTCRSLAARLPPTCRSLAAHWLHVDNRGLHSCAKISKKGFGKGAFGKSPTEFMWNRPTCVFYDRYHMFWWVRESPRVRHLEALGRILAPLSVWI